jgi:hypothetical protein
VLSLRDEDDIDDHPTMTPLPLDEVYHTELNEASIIIIIIIIFPQGGVIGMTKCESLCAYSHHFI